MRVSELNDKLPIKELRKFIKEHGLDVKTSGAGRSKKNIIVDIKKQYRQNQKLKKKAAKKNTRKRKRVEIDEEHPEVFYKVAEILDCEVSELYCDDDLDVLVKVKDPDPVRRCYILDTFLTFHGLKSNAREPTAYVAHAVLHHLPAGNATIPAINTEMLYNFKSPAALCRTIGFMKTTARWAALPAQMDSDAVIQLERD